MWYSAHLIMYFKLKHSEQSSYLVWENVILLQADSSEQAEAKAKERGKQEEVTTSDLMINNEPAALLFAGVRKIVECQNETDIGHAPNIGCELTYSQFVVDDEKALEKLAAGEAVEVRYID